MGRKTPEASSFVTSNKTLSLLLFLFVFILNSCSFAANIHALKISTSPNAPVEIDYQTFCALYKEYWPKVIRYAKELAKDDALAEDILQRVFISLWERRGQLTIACVEAYLKRAVKFAVLAELKKQLYTREGLTESADVMEFHAHELPDASLCYRELTQTLGTITAVLPKRNQKMFQLRYTEGMDNRQIAAIMEVSEKTIRNQLSLSLKLVRKRLRRVGYFLL